MQYIRAAAALALTGERKGQTDRQTEPARERETERDRETERESWYRYFGVKIPT